MNGDGGRHAHVGERRGDLGDRGGDVGVRGVVLAPPRGSGLLGLAAVDLDEAGVEQADHDHARLEDVKPQSSARSAIVRMPSTLHSRAQSYGPRTTSGAAVGSGREHRDGVGAADERDDLGPPLVALGAQSPSRSVTSMGGATSCRVRLPLRNFFSATCQCSRSATWSRTCSADERLDHGPVDEPEVDEQLAQAPALQLGALHLQGLGEGLGGEDAGGHEAYAEQRSAAGDGHGVDVAVSEPDRRLLALGLGDDEASGRLLRGELEQEAVHAGREAAVRHA